MKKFVTIALFAAAALSLNSCGFFSYMASSIANNPEFQVHGDGSSDGVYNGQTFRVIKTATCTYSFASSDPAQLVLKTEGSDAYVTGKLKKPEVTGTFKLTARNAQVDTIAPVVHDVSVYAWVLQVYDAAGNLVSNPKSLTRNNNYYIKMVRLGGSTSNPTYTPVAKLIGGVKLSAGDETINLPFKFSNTTFTVDNTTSTTCLFKTPAKAASCTVSATLGHYTAQLAIATK